MDSNRKFINFKEVIKRNKPSSYPMWQYKNSRRDKPN